MELLHHPSRLVALGASAGTRDRSLIKKRWAARRASRGAAGKLAAFGLLSMTTMELDVAVAIKSFDGGGVCFHGAQPKCVIGATATKTTTKIRGKVSNGPSRSRQGRVLIISLSGWAGLGKGSGGEQRCMVASADERGADKSRQWLLRWLRLLSAVSSWNTARTLHLLSCMAFQLSTARERDSQRVRIWRALVDMVVRSKVDKQMAR